jgi:hypothetical protein
MIGRWSLRVEGLLVRGKAAAEGQKMFTPRGQMSSVTFTEGGVAESPVDKGMLLHSVNGGVQRRSR